MNNNNWIIYIDREKLTKISSKLVGSNEKFILKGKAGKDIPKSPPIITSNITDQKQLLQMIKPAIAAILVMAQEGYCFGSGTGIIVSADGKVLTNRHVIANSTKQIMLRSDNKEPVELVLMGVSEFHDLALLRPASPLADSLPHLTFSASGSVEVLDDVMAVGYPFFNVAEDCQEPIPVTGKIGQDKQQEQIFQLTDCSLNHGCSGGPLFSLITKEMIGVIFAKHRESEGMGYAIKSEVAYKFLEGFGIARPYERFEGESSANR